MVEHNKRYMINLYTYIYIYIYIKIVIVIVHQCNLDGYIDRQTGERWTDR